MKMTTMIENLRTVANLAMSQAEGNRDIDLYNAGYQVSKLASALSAIEDLGHNSEHSAVIVELEFGSEAERGNTVDFSIEGVSDMGFKSHLASGIVSGDVCDLILEMAQEIAP